MIVTESMIFVENPKTASTSIRTLLVEHFAGAQRMHGSWTHVPIRRLNKKAYCDGLEEKKFRVVVVRNPFDRMVSGWLFEARKKEKVDFADWVAGKNWDVAPGIDFKRTSQLYWTRECNHVLRFENLAEELESVLIKVGITDYTLPHIHKHENRKPYPEYYDVRTRALVEDRFAVDLVKFGYSFRE